MILSCPPPLPPQPGHSPDPCLLPLPNRPLLNRPTAHPVTGRQRMEKRPRLEEYKAGSGGERVIGKADTACEECAVDFNFHHHLKRHQHENHPEEHKGQIIMFCGAADCQYSTTHQDSLARHKAYNNCPLLRCQLCSTLVKSMKHHFGNQRCMRRYSKCIL